MASYIVHTYIAYLVFSMAATIWVGRVLYRNGRTFLVDAFHGQEGLADSVNHLLVVGFYLINFGWIVRALTTYKPLETPRSAIELLSDKMGTVFLVLGVMHFFNLYLFSTVRRRGLDRLAIAQPPVLPTGFVQTKETGR